MSSNTPVMPSTSERRGFLKLLACGACALSMRSLTGCTVAEVFGVEAGGTFGFDLSQAAFAPLARIGGTVAVDVGGRPALLVRVTAAEVVALNRICTHTACDMAPGVTGRWDPDANELICLCHGSRFAVDGQVLQGPATTPLATYPVAFDPERGTGSVRFGAVSEADERAPTDAIAARDPDGGMGGTDVTGDAGASLYPERDNPFGDDPVAVAAGKDLYAASCGGCHGGQGEGNGIPTMPPPSAFAVDQSAWTDGYLYWRIETGATGGPSGSVMPAYATQLSDEDIWRIVSYLRSLAIPAGG
jgi:Rieske Fe-S protein/mono/diheme cytochrome c family protein